MKQFLTRVPGSVSLCASAFLLAACPAPLTVDAEKTKIPAAQSNLPAPVKLSQLTESKWSKCVGKALSRTKPKVRVVKASSVAKSSLSGGSFKARLTAAKVDYLVAVDGGTSEGPRKGFGSCNNYGCMGVGSRKQETKLSATVWNIRSGGAAEKLQVGVSGTGRVVALVVPFILHPYTEGRACRELADKIAVAIGGRRSRSSVPVAVVVDPGEIQAAGGRAKVNAQRAVLLKKAKAGDRQAIYALYKLATAPKDYWIWGCRAAHAGFGEVRASVGYWHEHGGPPVPQNLVHAYMWYRLALARNYRSAGSNLEQLKRKMTPAQIARAKRLVARWKPNSRECVVRGKR